MRSNKRRAFAILFIFVVIAAAFAAVSVSYAPFAADIGEETVEGFSCGDFIEYGGAKFASPVSGEIANLVIFICFSDESDASVRSALNETFTGYFQGEDNSLADYYSDVSYGGIEVETVFPYADDAYFVFKASKSRNYYEGIKKSASANTRYRAESELLNAAVNAAADCFDYGNIRLDGNRDGYVDSVTFLISGGYDNTDRSAWGGLLWPHSWDLATITRLAGGQYSYLNGIKVNRYSFNFVQTINTGLICHETGHVLGMPDLYHYERDTDRIQVGVWDLMHLNGSVPQYPTVYMRDKYLDAIGDNQIIDLRSGGSYTLKPVTSATAEDAVACRLAINEHESIWMEYRNNSVSTYDSELPGSGLIVYRVNTRAEGNTNGGYESTYFPDEVYVYRPSVFTSGDTLRDRELKNLNLAYLSGENSHYSAVGSKAVSGEYNQQSVFLTNGQNTGVVITAGTQSDESMTFTVDTNGYGSAEISDMYVEGSPEINYGETPLVTVKLKISGYDGYATADPSRYTIEYDDELIGIQTATVRYTDEDGEEITCSFQLKINDRVEANGVEPTVLPVKREYDVNEAIDLSGLSLTVRYVSGATVSVEYMGSNAHQWEISGVDTSVSGSYDMRVSYRPFDVYVYIKVTVMTELTAIRVSEKNSLTVVDPNESLVLNVEGVYADGTVRTLSAEDYISTVYSKSVADLYRRQTVTVTSKENPSLQCVRDIYLVKYADLISLESKKGPDKSLYKYGEALDLSGGVLVLSFSGGFVAEVPAENYYNVFDGVYSATKRGLQSLSGKICGKVHTVNVTVLAPDGSLLTATGQGAEVNISAGYVLFDGSADLAAAERIFSSYLGVRFMYVDGALEYAVSSRTHPAVMMCSAVRIELLNGDGRVIMALKVHVRGDANGDGRADGGDLDGWANALFRRLPASGIYLDMNGDGVYNLTDFVLLVERYGGSHA